MEFSSATQRYGIDYNPKIYTRALKPRKDQEIQTNISPLRPQKLKKWNISCQTEEKEYVNFIADLFQNEMMEQIKEQ